MIPDFLPTLHQGAHPKGSGSACVMEYVSVLAGEKWSDKPKCVHPFIANVARCINDGYGDNERQHMLGLVPRLLTANVPVNERDDMGEHLRRFTRRWIVKNVEQYPTIECKCGCGLTLNYGGYPDGSETVAIQKGGIRFLSDLLDEFDRHAGREVGRKQEVADEDRKAALCRIQGVPYIPPLAAPKIEVPLWKPMYVYNAGVFVPESPKAVPVSTVSVVEEENWSAWNKIKALVHVGK